MFRRRGKRSVTGKKTEVGLRIQPSFKRLDTLYYFDRSVKKLNCFARLFFSFGRDEITNKANLNDTKTIQ